MSANNYVKFLTEELVKYMNQPKEERRKEREQHADSFPLNRWFGVLPFSFRLFIKR